MAKEQETIADIIAEKRALADRLEHEMAVAKECKEPTAHRTAQTIIDSTRREADRLDAAHRRERVVCARMREAIEKVIEISNKEWDAFHETPAMWEMWEICTAALAAPPRNCDVGTAEEQRKRFGEFCQSHSWHEIDGEHCRASCPLYHGDKAPCDELEWAQMPYESEAQA